MEQRATAIFGYETANLGDDMQSIAALAHLNRIEGIYSRDMIHKKARRTERTTCIFNSWFKQGELKKPPPKIFDSLMYGISIGKPELLDGPWFDYFRQRAPIGCRDRHTQKLFISRGIEAHFTACLTLQIGKKMDIIPAEQRKGILIVDIDRQYLEKYFRPNIWEDSVFYTMEIGAVRRRPFSRLKLMSDLLYKIANSKLIITRRLHVGSPAISLGTPVILLPNRSIGKANERFSGFEELINFQFQDELTEKLAIDQNDMLNTYIKSHQEVEKNYKKLVEHLKERHIFAENQLSWIYPEQQIFRFDAATWPDDAIIFACCGWAEQPLSIRSRQGDIIEATLPGFIGYDRFKIEFFIELPDGSELFVAPINK